MKAMIFAAGLGTRLKPLTDTKPKALIEIKGVTLLDHTIDRLADAGFDEIIINVHHYAEMIKQHLKKRRYSFIHFEVSDESNKLLDTGGGLKKASWFFNDNKPFLVHNVDVISDIDLKHFYNLHRSSLVALAVRNRETSRYLLFDEHLYLCGWKNLLTGKTKVISGKEKDLIPYAFSGIQILHPAIFDLMNENGKFSLIDFYLRTANYIRIDAFVHNEGYWLDVGKPESLNEAGKLI